MGASYSFEPISIVHLEHQFIGHNKIFLGSVRRPQFFGSPGAADFAYSALVAPLNDPYTIFKIAGPILVSKK